jgi:hypothetical protein
MNRTRLPPLRRGFRIGAAFHWLARVKVRSACLPNETTARKALRAPTQSLGPHANPRLCSTSTLPSNDAADCMLLALCDPCCVTHGPGDQPCEKTWRAVRKLCEKTLPRSVAVFLILIIRTHTGAL